MTEPQPPLLKLQNVSISTSEQVLMHNVTLTVHAGESVALLGTSGLGKSTLLRAICGLLPQHSFTVAGQMKFLGRDLNHLTPKQWRALRGPGLALMGQNISENFDERQKLLSHFIEAVRAHERGRSKADITQAALDLLYRLELAYPERILQQYSYEFSLGMSQRVALALTLILKPKLILADEFTSALDLNTRLAVLTELKALQQELGFALLFVTHHPDESHFMAQRHYLLHDGVITEQHAATSAATTTTATTEATPCPR